MFLYKVTVHDNDNGTLSFSEQNLAGTRTHTACAACEGTGQIDGASCAACTGMGYTLGDEYTVAEGDAAPVFINDLHNGKLNLKKAITSGDPSQEFTFRIKLAGMTGTISIDREQGDATGGDDDGSGGDDEEDISGIKPVFHADDSVYEGTTAYAALNKTTGELIFFRCDPDDLMDPWGNNFNMSGASSYNKTSYKTIGDYIYYTGFDAADYGWSDSNSRPAWSGIADQRSLVKTVTMRDPVRVRTLAHYFRECSNIVSIDLSKMDVLIKSSNTSPLFSFYYTFNGLNKLKMLDLGTMDLLQCYDMENFVYNCSSLETVNIGHLSTQYNTSNWYNNSFTNTKVTEITIGNNMKFPISSSYYPKKFGNYADEWVNVDTGETLTSYQLFTQGNHAGTWQLDPKYYNVEFDSTGVVGSMQSRRVNSHRDFNVGSTFYKFGYRFTGYTDQFGNVFEANEKGKIRIPAGFYDSRIPAGGELTVTLTPTWEPLSNDMDLERETFTVTMYGGESITVKDIPAGTQYEIWEQVPDGWILVSRTNDSGVIEPLQTEHSVFTDEYAPGSATTAMKASKLFDGQLSAEPYTFGLYEVVNGTETLIQTKDNSRGGVASFDIIRYDYPDGVGQHDYIIREIIPAEGDEKYDPTVEYDTHSERVTVLVTDDGKGNLFVVTSYRDGTGQFKNNTKPGTLTLTKAGENMTDAAKEAEFTFVIRFTDKNGNPADVGDAQYSYVRESSGVPEWEVPASTAAKETPKPSITVSVPDTALTPYYATELHGTAYVVISDGKLTFIRSEETVEQGTNGSITDIHGDTYTGQIYSGVEDGNRYWSSATYDVEFVDPIKPTGMSGWFDGCTVNSFTGLEQVDTSACTNLAGMFYQATVKTDLDLGSMDLTAATSLASMFAGSQLQNLIMPGKTAPVTETGMYAFLSGAKAGKINLNGWSLPNATTLGYMFAGLKADTLSADDWTAPNATTLYNNNNNNNGAFQNMNLTALSVDGWNIPKVTGLGGIFGGSTVSQGVNMNEWNAPLASVGGLFYNLTTDVLTANDMTYGNGVGGLFYSTRADTTYINGWKSETNTNMGGLFSNINGRVVEANDWSSPLCTNLDGIFSGASVHTLNMTGWNVPEVTSATSGNAGSLVYVDMSGWKAMPKLGNVSGLFSNATSLQKVDMTSFDMSNVSNFSSMFYNCGSLEEIAGVEDWNVSKAQYFSSTFYGTKLTSMDLSSWQPTAIQSVYRMFYNCGSLKCLDISGFSLLNVSASNKSDMLYGTDALILLKLGDATVLGNVYQPNKTWTNGNEYLSAQEILSGGHAGTWYPGEEETYPAASEITVTLKAGESVEFKDLPAGVNYQITETIVPDGWTLTDTENGTGTIKPITETQSTFTNTYAASGYAALKAEKQVEGEIPEGFAYTFHLYEADENGEPKGEALQTKTNNPLDKAEKITVDEKEENNPDYNKSMVLFDQIKYTEEGTYRYVIVEDTEVQDETIITDARKILATVKVTDVEGKGKLVTEVTYTGGENNSNIFLNKREDGSLKISKTILGATEVSEETEFTVTLQLTDKNDEPVEGTFAAVRTNGDGEETEETVTVTEGRTEIGIKGAETVLIRGLPHGAAYEAEEEGVDGWTNTDASGESGTIIGKETSEVSFENTYDAKGKLTLEVQKKMDPADLETPEGAFSFILMEGRSEVERAQNDAKGHAAFHPIQYSLEDVGKTFTYTIQEQTSTNYATPVGYAFDSTQYTVTVTVKDNGDGTLDATPVFTKNGETVDEIVFTNSTRVDIPIRKVWTEDADVVGDVRPARVLVQLLADGEVAATRAISTGNATAEDSNIWESKFTGMPEYKDGKKIVYTVQEVAPANYSASIDNGDETLVITNIYLEAPVTVSGKKVLKGEPVTEGAYSFKLEAPYGGAPMPENDVVSCDAEGKFSFGEMVFRLEDLDQDDEGNLINDTVLTYKVREVIPEEAVLNEEGTVYMLDGVNYDAHVYEVNVTLHYDESANTFTAAKDKEADDILFTNWKDQISLKVIKEWKGAEGGKVELTLYRVQEGEYIRVTDAPEFKFIEEESAYVCEPLPCLDENNEEIIYAVKETGMEGYLTTYVNTGAHASDTDAAFNGATIINTFVTEGSYQPEAKKELSGRALKKNEFSFILTAVDKNGAALTGEDAYSETVSNDADGKVKFTEIRYQMADMDQANGRLEDTRKYYRVKEVVPEDEYKEAGMIYSAKESTITVTLHLNEEGKIEATPDKTISDLVFNNTYVTEKPITTRLSVIKNWSDNNDQDGKRGSVGATVQLYRKVGDSEAAAVGAAVQVGTENGWSKTWSGLPVYENGTAIKYYVVETLPENSEYTKSGDGESTGITASEKENLGTITITNSYEAEKPKTTQLSVTKLWADNNDQDGKRGSVGATVQLYRKVGDSEATAVGAAEQVGTADGWSKTWSELPVYENGTAIKYYVVETLPENSEYSKSGDGESTGITASEIDDLGAITITNSYESKQTKITVTKLWEDNNDQDGKRGSVGATVQLYKTLEGEATEQKPVAVGAPVKVGTEDRWSYTWEKLPLYENGRKISYSVKELLPENSEYTSDAGDAPAEVTESEDGLIVEITNSYKPEVTEIPVTKVWNDNNDEDQVRPASITVSLLANGEVVAEQRITAKDGWAYTFEELPVYADGKKITYTVREKPVADYDMPVITGSAEKGFEIKNTHESKPKPTPVPYYFKFTFTKIWQGEHGDSIDWVLYKPDGTVAHKKFDKKVISENEWYYEAWFATDADYYILENVPEGYKVRYENVGAHAGETDRCYNGGTIVNYKVPRTGDRANLWPWAVMALAGAGAVCGVVVYSKKKKDKR